MSLRKISVLFLFVAMVLVCAAANQEVAAQSTDQAAQIEKRVDETNLDTQLYLLIASNQDVGDSKLPATLDPVVKQLRASLPFKNYRLASTLINRVKNEGRLNLNWIGGPLASATASASTPSFNQFKINQIKLVRDIDGQQLVRMDGFGFGARIPIQTATGPVASNAPPFPVVNYENTGLNTDFSMREGEPVVVGTLNVGPSGDAIILVMSVKRSGR